MSDRERRRRNRRALLESLYEAAEADVRTFVSAFEPASALDMDTVETGRVLAYLEEKGFVFVDDFKAGIVRITSAGIDEVEGRD